MNRSLVLAILALSLAAHCANFKLVESIPQQVKLVTGESTYDAWESLIINARKSLLIGQYYWTLTDGAGFPKHEGWRGQKIFDLVRDAHKRGVNVRIVQNIPEGSFTGNETALLAAEGSAEVVSVNYPKLGIGGIFHTKMMVADEDVTYIGSANMDWRSLTQVKELGLVFSGSPELAADASKIFFMNWIAGRDGKLPPKWPADLETAFNQRERAKLNIDGTTGEVYLAVSPSQFCTPKRTDATEAAIRSIGQANRTVDIEVMDYMPTSLYQKPNFYWPIIDDALRSAAFRGVKVRMLVSLWNHTHFTMARYLRSLNALQNIEVRWFVVPELEGLDPVPFTRVNHAKFMVTDDEASITTSNWSADYFLDTGGITVIVKHADFAFRLKQTFERDWVSSYTHPVV